MFDWAARLTKDFSVGAFIILLSDDIAVDEDIVPLVMPEVPLLLWLIAGAFGFGAIVPVEPDCAKASGADRATAMEVSRI
ncbi:hypothetical protein [Mangrovibrevibacter kandeliae]|uniref:hypothetical protein n=1 Tax=Mangrovibrevibacter kandeliae TaxID=2968473 RepID=UPI002118A046|nr:MULTISPECIES: hypothetical protein [unclassified Aurantimonas]MCQ8782345.1 hypothetical protein [Aurantimonas sp. CSK15Z-1]MCW4115008.1 hypothetical protein [Aurantimonas sp. MSK8Z-1]